MKMKIKDRVEILDHEDVSEFLRNQIGIIWKKSGDDYGDPIWEVKLDFGGTAILAEGHLKQLEDSS